MKGHQKKVIYIQRMEYRFKLILSGNAYYAFDTSEELEDESSKMPNWQYNAISRTTMKNSLSLSKERGKKKE